MPDPYKILIVEDDPTIAGALAGSLQGWGFEPVRCTDFADVLGAFTRAQAHLVILDISLPQCNGFYWCAEIRRVSPVPILFLSSHTADSDIILAVNMGGDDYVQKPFTMDVLIAKVHAMMRRAYQYEAAPRRLTARGAELLEDGTLRAGETVIQLTRNEHRILRVLMAHPNTVVPREMLMRALWEDEHFIDENTLTVVTSRLRKKLEAAGLAGFIITRKGEGYLIRG